MNSDVRIVGNIQAKNEVWACASIGEKPISIVLKPVYLGYSMLWMRTFQFGPGSEEDRHARSTVGKDEKREKTDSAGRGELGLEPRSFEDP